MRKPDEIEGGILRPAAAIGNDYANTIQALVRLMAEDTKRRLVRLFENPDYAMDAAISASLSEGGNIASRSRIIINDLLEKYGSLFGKDGKRATDRMMARNLKNSSVALGLSLKDVGEGLRIDTGVVNDRVRLIYTASTNEAAVLIKTIPQEYLSQVQGEVMRSITTGRGLADLVPFLEEKYGQNIRKARNVALDQTRKAFNSITAAKMDAVGVKQFRWIHSGGGAHPRKQHQGWHGKVFRLDDLPVDDAFGPVLPGQAINCRCTMQPIISFKSEE